ncbi:P-loop containing nucleoside triphosphate hydrolase protein [Xylariaceae sp. FL1272]|nr:P-loop containing nucleoside triphosphate hydrolase protein [Xylariaceae sp. FL1272]
MSLIKIKGVLLYGPPGTGKTHLARAVAKSSGAHMLILDGSTITSFDSLFFRRNDGEESWERAALTQFLQEMDGITQSNTAPFVLVATNRPGDLDSAFIRRLPQRIPFGLPNAKARADILRTFLKDDDLDGVDIDNVAALTEGYSGSDLKSLCGKAGLMWAIEQQLGLKNLAKKAYQALKLLLTNAHFVKALNKIKPSVSAQDMKAMEDFHRKFNSGKSSNLALPYQGRLCSVTSRYSFE